MFFRIILLIGEKPFVLAHFTRQNNLFQKKTLKIHAQNSFFQNEPKFVCIILELFNFQVFEKLKLNRLANNGQRLDLEDGIWRLKFGKMQFWSSNLKNKFLSLDFWKASFNSLGRGRGAQVGKTSLLEVNLYGASDDVGRINFWFGTLQALGPAGCLKNEINVFWEWILISAHKLKNVSCYSIMGPISTWPT